MGLNTLKNCPKKGRWLGGIETSTGQPIRG